MEPWLTQINLSSVTYRFSSLLRDPINRLHCRIPRRIEFSFHWKSLSGDVLRWTRVHLFPSSLRCSRWLHDFNYLVVVFRMHFSPRNITLVRLYFYIAA